MFISGRPGPSKGIALDTSVMVLVNVQSNGLIYFQQIKNVPVKSAIIDCAVAFTTGAWSAVLLWKSKGRRGAPH